MQRTITNPFVKDKVTFLKTFNGSGGTITEVEVYLMPGGGTPMHFHRSYAETFMAGTGILGLELSGGRKVYLKPGEMFTVPKTVKHRFFNDNDEAVTFRTIISPGHIGFEYSLRIAYGLANDGLTNNRSIPKSFLHLAVLMKMGDSNLTGILTLLKPFVNFLNKKAIRKGIDQILIDRYCS